MPPQPLGEAPPTNWAASTRSTIFDTFVIGSSNRFAHAAAVAVAEAPAKAYNPLFIYGDSGLGKTHLLHAIGHYARHLYSGIRVRYVNSEEFTNDFINSIRDDEGASFKQLYRNVDILLIDDIQFLADKDADAGRVLPHVQRSAQPQQASGHHLRPAAEAARRLRGPDAVALRVGAADGHPAAGAGDPDRDPAQEGHQRGLSAPDEVLEYIASKISTQHPRARGRPDPRHRFRQPEPTGSGHGPCRDSPQGPHHRRGRAGNHVGHDPQRRRRPTSSSAWRS